VFVAFEGIDGSGKTTLSNAVCEALRRGGHAVVHARERGVLATGVARRVRELTRDRALVEMSARAELLLNLAREAQQLEEVVRPALSRGHWCVADRSLHSIAALAAGGRGLPQAEVSAAAAAASGGTSPDLVILVDVDPDVARYRKDVARVRSGRPRDAGSRKGLAGIGLQERIRAWLLAAARADPARWLVVGTVGQPPGELAEQVARWIVGRVPPSPAMAGAAGGEGRWELVISRGAGGRPSGREPADLDLLAARFFDAVDAVAPAEPDLAARLLAGIPGPDAHARRRVLAGAAPRLVARGLLDLADPRSVALRRALAAVAPADVAASLGGDPSPWASRLREELVDRAPAEIAAGLAGDGSGAAWSLRDRALAAGALAAVLEGLAGVDGEAAWIARQRGLQAELWDAVGRSLAAVEGPRADALRAELVEHSVLAALRASLGRDDDLARRLRDRLLAHAPRAVLRSLLGVDAPHAWAVRARALPLAPEALASIEGMDGEPAWALRDAGLALWPAAAVGSLGRLAGTARGRDAISRALQAAPARLGVLREAHAARSRALAGIAPRRPGPNGAAPAPGGHHVFEPAAVAPSLA